MNEFQSMQQKIKNWLEKNGYPLEMRVARKLAQGEFGVTQSQYYEDHESGKSREIDVIARLYNFVEPKNYTAIAELETFSTIECKSTSHPWVVFCETTPNVWNIEQALSNKAGEKLLMRSRKELGKTTLYGWSRTAGHGVAQALGGNEDMPYSAVMSASKAAEAKSREALLAEAKWNENKENAEICLSVNVIPAIVIMAPLFECRLCEEGNIELNQVEHSSLVLRYPQKKRGNKAGVVVHIVTEPALDKFMESVLQFHGASKSALESMIPLESEIT